MLSITPQILVLEKIRGILKMFFSKEIVLKRLLQNILLPNNSIMVIVIKAPNIAKTPNKNN
jgi:hypothetical protein